MSRKKISELTATTDLVSGDVFIVNDAGTTKKVDFDVLQEKVRGYKVYTALVTQSGAFADPTVTVLENTIGAAPTLSYSNTGEYLIYWAQDTFTPTTASVSMGSLNTNGFLYYAIYNNVSGAGVQINTSDTLAAMDSLLTNTYLEIRVYE